MKKYHLNIYFAKINKYIKPISDNKSFKINNKIAQYNIIYNTISQFIFNFFDINHLIFIIIFFYS